jgi:hypothetical protein
MPLHTAASDHVRPEGGIRDSCRQPALVLPKAACDKPNWRIHAEIVLLAALAVTAGIGIGVAHSASTLSALGAHTSLLLRVFVGPLLLVLFAAVLAEAHRGSAAHPPRRPD